MLVYTFKVALFYNKRIYRTVEILENQSLNDLHESIFEAFERYDEHLYSFFLTRKATRSTTIIYDSPEYTHPMNMEDYGGFGFKKRYNAQKTKIRKLNLAEKDKLYYLFDFGDDWWHELTVLKVREGGSSKKKYPRIVKVVGESPDQYPDYEDYDGEDAGLYPFVDLGDIDENGKRASRGRS